MSLSKLDSFRDIFEENAFALSYSSHLCRLIPFILQDEMCKLKQDKHVAIIYDGTGTGSDLVVRKDWQLEFDPRSRQTMSVLTCLLKI